MRQFYGFILNDTNKKRDAFNASLQGVVPTGIEPVTRGFSVLCSTN